MTTDITELAKREKFEAWWEREYKHLESSKYTDAVPHIKYGFWMAYQAGGAELVEALKKAQRYANLTEAERQAYLGLISKRDERIAELESRTVKMPEPFKLAKSSSGLTYYYADEVNEALSAAGIKWEAE
ncbi:hypothetical protein [Raoultella planticola]|jgi:hypothetical protein|uniref:hypothetical protein n=1 Tax=Raoultella planticola TaxID=575 RepID=UPI002073CC01|nr:hypothetical protein [Raoultella planticola]